MTQTTPPPRHRLSPDRSLLVDLTFAVGLSCLAVLGFDSSFGGSEAYFVGLPAVVAGAAVGLVIARVRPPLLLGAAAGVIAFFLLGGVLALRSDAIFGVLPNAEVWSGLVDGAVNGWARLLTTVPPAGQAGNLLAIPYLAGFAGAALAVILGLLVSRWPVCLIPPTFVLVVSVLFGVDEPASLLLQGAAFGAVAVGWLAVRASRTGRPLVAHGRGQKVVRGVALLGVAGASAFVVGPRLPMADANHRFVLREQVKPPFDPSQYPSPLTRFRSFDTPPPPQGEPIEGTLFTVEGLPSGQVVRVAVMDAYDGYVWRASPPGTPKGGTYQRVGDEIPGAAEGPSATVRFEMGTFASRDSVWIPTAGSPTSIRFTGARAEELTESFRFNRAAEAAASPLALEPGDTWEVEATFPKAATDAAGLNELATDPRFATDPTSLYPDEVIRKVSEWTAGAGSSYEQATAILGHLKEVGAYNPGLKDFPIASGHSLARLVPFVEQDQPQGNGEQFAAAVAYLAESIGIPARVVLEFKASGDGAVNVVSDDIVATVEIALEGVGWVALEDPTPYDNEPESQAQRKTQTQVNEVQPPPPTTIPPPNSIPDEPDREDEDTTDRASDGSAGFDIVGLLRTFGMALIPVAVIAAPGLVVAGLKARRRKHRRTSGRPAQRIAGGWNEVVDLARDMGTAVPPRATRREISRFAQVASVGPLAEQIDAAVFGHVEPDDAVAEDLWRDVDSVRSEMLADQSRVGRLRATVSLTSLRGGR